MLRKLAVLMLLFAPLAAACNDDDPHEPAPLNLTGTWNVTHIELVSSENPEVSIDMTDLGVTATLVFEADGDFTFTVVVPMEETETFAGNWTYTETLTLEHVSGGFAGWTWEFLVSVQNGVLSLTGAEAQYDFDEDGNEDPAILNLTVVKA